MTKELAIQILRGEVLGTSEQTHEAVFMAIKALKNDFKWIPIEEGPPKNDDWVLITILDEHGDTPYRYTDFGWYLEAAKCWIVDAECRNDIIAWAKMPEPYKKKDEQ